MLVVRVPAKSKFKSKNSKIARYKVDELLNTPLFTFEFLFLTLKHLPIFHLTHPWHYH